MLAREQIAQAELTDWRKLGQGLHARYVVADFGAGVRFVAAVGEAGDALDHHPRVTMGDGYIDFKLVSDDAAGPEDCLNLVERHDGRAGSPSARGAGVDPRPTRTRRPRPRFPPWTHPSRS
jgi:pterin-4a-carbinolamine dehydratase